VREKKPSLMVVDIATVGAYDVAIITNTPMFVNAPCSASFIPLTDLFAGVPAMGTGFPLSMTMVQWVQNLIYKVEFMARMAMALVELVPTKQALGVVDVYQMDMVHHPLIMGVFINTIEGLDYAGPVLLSHVHYIGPMLQEAEELTGDLKQWLDREGTVVYLGLGSAARLNREQLQVLANALIAVDGIRVLWKLPADRHPLLPPDLPQDKFRVEKWVPSQLSVLLHPNVKLFISHVGGNGYHEGIYAGKPQLAIPMWHDCYDFAERVVSLGMGLAVENAPRFTADAITNKTREILSNKSYTEEAQFWSMRMRTYGGPSQYGNFIESCTERPHSCKPNHVNPVEKYQLFIKFAFAVLVWGVIKKVLAFIVRLCKLVVSRATKKKKRD